MILFKINLGTIYDVIILRTVAENTHSYLQM